MEAVVFFVFFGIYLAIRVMIGGGESEWEKQIEKSKVGLFYFNTKNYEEAKIYFENAIRVKPFASINHVILGEIALHEKEYEKALFHAQKALRLDNTVSDAHLLMSKGLYHIEDFAEALNIAKKAAWFNRHSPEANLWLGKLLLEKGEIEKGIHHLEIAYSLGDEDAGYSIKSAKTKN